jgi:predicted transcriptional regulator
MVYQREALNLSYEAIGHNLGVDPSTVYRTVNLFKTGNVDKKQYNTANLPRKLTD